MVSVLAFYSNDPGSNPAGFLNFLYEKTKINEKETGVGSSLKKLVTPGLVELPKLLREGNDTHFAHKSLSHPQTTQEVESEETESGRSAH